MPFRLNIPLNTRHKQLHNLLKCGDTTPIWILTSRPILSNRLNINSSRSRTFSLMFYVLLKQIYFAVDWEENTLVVYEVIFCAERFRLLRRIKIQIRTNFALKYSKAAGEKVISVSTVAYVRIHFSNFHLRFPSGKTRPLYIFMRHRN